MEIEFWFCKMKSSRDCFHDHVNVLNATELLLKHGYNSNFYVICILP